MPSTAVSHCLRRSVGGGMGLALAAASLTATASPATADDYVVQPGDTVSHIARRTGVTVQAIVAANKLDARATIRVGQHLMLPTAAAATPQTAPAPQGTQTPAATHTVAAGETVSALAARYGTTVQAIVAANGLDSRAFIRIGQVLSIPGAAPAAATSAPAAPAAQTATHTVAAGETVSALAARYGTTVQAIVAANGLDSRAFIRIGQVLSIPGAAPATATSAPAAPATQPTQGQSAKHTVVSGDTVAGLAARYGTTTQAIISANRLDSRALIRIGQVLDIPGATTVTTVGNVTSGVGNTFAGRTYPQHVVAAANQNLAALRSVGVPSKDEMRALISQTAREMGVDPALALAVAYQESGFNHAVVSPANAIGAMQVIPSSGDWASNLVGRKLNLLDPRDNVVAGVAILRQLVRTAPDLPTAIAGYYQGLAGVQRNGMYDDTRRYVANVQTLMSRFA